MPCGTRSASPAASELILVGLALFPKDPLCERPRGVCGTDRGAVLTAWALGTSLCRATSCPGGPSPATSQTLCRTRAGSWVGSLRRSGPSIRLKPWDPLQRRPATKERQRPPSPKTRTVGEADGEVVGEVDGE